ncbi:MAG: Ig-like domain-containing protein [Dehalococcoidia bacterium]
MKWLGAVAALALFVVAVAGSSATTSAAEGTIYVANEWSMITNEPGDPGDYTTGSSVYGTYPADTTSGEPVRRIQNNAELIKIVILDEDQDETTSIVDDNGNGGFTLADTVQVGDSVVFTLNDDASPIAGVQDDIDLLLAGTTNAATAIRVTNFYEGDPDAVPPVAGWVRVERLSGATDVDFDIRYPTSAVDVIDGPDTGNFTAVAKSDVDTTGVNLILEETTRSSGRFEGYLRLTDRNGDQGDGIASADATGAAPGNSAILRVGSGPVSIEYEDTDEVTRIATVLIDVSAPVVAITSPTHDTATQNRRPIFAGTVNETGAGLMIDEFELFLDKTTDVNNNTDILNAAGAVQGGGNGPEAVSTSGTTDGALSFSFSHTPSADLPNTGVAAPDHLVDFQVKASDLAGNIGFSDNDGDPTPDAEAGNQGVDDTFQAHVVKVDQVLPAFSTVANANQTGIGLDGAGDEVLNRRSIRITFNDNVQNVEASDFLVTLDNGTTFVADAAIVDDDKVYLLVSSDIPSNDTPRVELQGTIQDLAGNSTSAGNIDAVDGLPPMIDALLSGGTGTGSGAESAASLTRTTLVIEVTSDENLSLPPSVRVYQEADRQDVIDAIDGGLALPAAEATPSALSQGSNVWRATYTGTGLASGQRFVVVTADDAAAGANEAIITPGDDKAFTLDTDIPSAAKTPADGAEISQRRPFIDLNFSSETSSVEITELLLNGDDVTDQVVASAGNKRYFLLPSSDLDLGEQTVSVKAIDAAGNNNTTADTFSFTIVDRGTFDLGLFAGWNSVSFPSDPVDPDINTVFSNPGVDQVVAYNATTPNSPWRIATKDSATGLFSSTTSPALNSINAGPAYWAHTNDFDAQEVELVGRTEPGSGSPPAVITIPTGQNWNFVGVVDQRREQTEGVSGATLMRTTVGGGSAAVTVEDYFGSVNDQRVYRYDATGLEFVQLGGADTVEIGEGIWVFVSPQSDGSLPAIVP